ncbi:hypothetical protein ACQY0O_003654 [Thecaphora frezii]
MQLTRVLVALTQLFLLAPMVLAKVQFRFHYSKEWVDVGSFDLNWLWWTDPYSHTNNEGGIYNAQYKSYHCNCCHYEKQPDGLVTVSVDAAWGNLDNMGGWRARDFFILALKTALDRVSIESSYPSYHMCSGMSWQETASRDRPKGMGCGNPGTPSCKGFCPNPGMATCKVKNWGRKLPQRIQILAYDENDRLLPDHFYMNIGSHKGIGDEHCNRNVDILNIFFGLVPELGQYVVATIRLLCITMFSRSMPESSDTKMLAAKPVPFNQTAFEWAKAHAPTYQGQFIA